MEAKMNATLSKMLVARGFNVEKETSIQAVGRNRHVRILINKEADGTFRASTKTHIGGWSEPNTLNDRDELAHFMDNTM